jgi:ribosomal protein L5
MDLKERYIKEVVPALMTKFNYKSVMQVPKLEKIVINMGVSDVKDNSKALDIAAKDLEAISGQKPLITKAKKSIAAFKLREGMNIGCKVTLRREKMYDFATRLFDVALPRVRDFKGLSTKSFDGSLSLLSNSACDKRVVFDISESIHSNNHISYIGCSIAFIPGVDDNIQPLKILYSSPPKLLSVTSTKAKFSGVSSAGRFLHALNTKEKSP